MDLIVFEQDRPFIMKALASGEFDYIEAANEVAEADFFRGMFARKVIEQLAESYPTPRQKEEVPLWLYIASVCARPSRSGIARLSAFGT